MKIIFQYGEFYNESSFLLSFLTGISGALLSGLIAIIIFRAGILMDKKRERKKEIDRLNELKEYFQTLVRNLTSSAHKQAFKCIEFGRLLRERKINEYLFDSVSAFDLLNIKKVPQQDLYKIIVSNSSGGIEEKTERLRKMQDKIEFLDRLPDSFVKMIDEFNPRFIQTQENWNNAVQKAANFFYTIRNNALMHGVEKDQAKFVSEFDRIFYKYQTLNESDNEENITDWFVVYDNLVKPMIKLCRDHQTNPNAIILTNIVNECRIAFKDLEHNLIFTSNYFIKQGRRLNKSIIELNKLINEI